MKVSSEYMRHPFTGKMISPGDLYGVGDSIAFENKEKLSNTKKPDSNREKIRLEKLNMTQLQELASKLGIDAAGMKKTELFKTISNVMRDVDG